MTNKTTLKGICPICDAEITLPADTVESEVVSCTDCKSRLVVESVEKQKASLTKAPDVEEDWGE